MNQWVSQWAYRPLLNIAIPELIAVLYSEKLNHYPLDSCRGEKAHPGSLEQGYFNSVSLHFRIHCQELLLIFYFPGWAKQLTALSFFTWPTKTFWGTIAVTCVFWRAYLFPIFRKASYNWPKVGLGVCLKAWPALIPAFSSVTCSSRESHMASQNSVLHLKLFLCIHTLGMKWRLSVPLCGTVDIISLALSFLMLKGLSV